MKIVFTSDTHTKENLVKIPKCDVLCHAGDYDLRSERDLIQLDDWFGKQKAKYRIFISGNHDFFPEKVGKEKIKSLLKHSTYLEDEEIIIEGIKFYGFPWTPIFYSWAFMLNHEGMKKKIEKIPDDVDVLISHGPPCGILDQVKNANATFGMSVGCVPLRDEIKKRIKPSVCAFGHIHEAAGKYYDGQTHFLNVSFLDEMYHPTNEPTILHIYKSKGKLEVV